MTSIIYLFIFGFTGHTLATLHVLHLKIYTLFYPDVQSLRAGVSSSMGKSVTKILNLQNTTFQKGFYLLCSPGISWIPGISSKLFRFWMPQFESQMMHLLYVHTWLYKHTHMHTHTHIYIHTSTFTHIEHTYFLWNVTTVKFILRCGLGILLFLVVDRNSSRYECTFVHKPVSDPCVRSCVQLEACSIFNEQVKWPEISTFSQHYIVSPFSYFILSSRYTSIPPLRTGY